MSNVLISIIDHKGQSAVNARELHAFLGVGKRFLVLDKEANRTLRLD